MHKFIPHLANIVKPLRELLEKSVEWYWTERQQKAYVNLINSITKASVLKYFEASADSSSEGLGACLLQGMQPVAYVSKALNNAEHNNAQIEKCLQFYLAPSFIYLAPRSITNNKVLHKKFHQTDH